MAVEYNKGVLSIGGFNDGVSQSALAGIPYMQNVEVDLIPGVAMVSRKHVLQGVDDITPRTFNAETAGNTITYSGDELVIYNNGSISTEFYSPVRFTTTGTLPAGLSLNTTYFLRSGYGSKVVKVCTSLKNVDDDIVIDITSIGSGVHTMTVIQPTIVIDSIMTRHGLVLLDEDGHVWLGNLLIIGNTATGAERGLGYLKDYLLVFRSNSIDIMSFYDIAKIYDPVGTSAWTLSWQSITSSFTHNAKLAVDGKLYFTNGNNIISKIEEVAGYTFNPATPATYLYTAIALTMPNNIVATVLEELGGNLYIGTTTNLLYRWDKYSNDHDYPITVEYNTSDLLSVGNYLYIFGGTSGKIYYTNGTSVAEYYSVPGYLNQEYSYPSLTFGNAIYDNGKIMFSFRTNTNSYVISGVYGRGGIGFIDLNTKAFTIKNVFNSSSGSLSYFGLFSISSGIYYTQYANDSDIDRLNYVGGPSNGFYSDSSAYFEIALVNVGSSLAQHTFTEIIMSLAENIRSGESINVYFRENLRSNYVLCATLDTAGMREKTFDFAQTCSDIQFKVVLNMTSGNYTDSSYVKLKSIICR
jgi:hypothetical protein